MPIINSENGSIVKNYTAEELVEKAAMMRAYNMIAITAAGSGHPGGTLSIMDITAALYLKVASHDPRHPGWDGRDRIFWSAGHKAPALYAALGASGYFPIKEMVKLRKLGSGFEGHPNRLKLPGIEMSTGSLGQGLGIAAGSALNAKQSGKGYRVYCIMGDGEQNEGSIWEAAMCAAHYKLDNLTAVIDMNKLQIDGATDEVMCLGCLAEKYRAFRWNVIEIDGHDMPQILDAFEKARLHKGSPTVIIADTVKGKGVSYAEGVVGYHGVAPKDGLKGPESLETALENIGYEISSGELEEILQTASDYQKTVDEKITEKIPKFSRDYWWNSGEGMKVDMVPTRMGFGKALEEIGADEKTVAYGADISGSIKIDQFYKNHPERKERFFSVGIAEQNMIQAACGMAAEGRIPFVGSYGVFVTGRAWDQIRTTACYNELDLKIADAHGGISVGADGATHQALEEISLMSCLPGMKVAVPCDSFQTYRATKELAYIPGPAVIRYAREATPVVTSEKTPYEFGKANIARYRGGSESFPEAFEWFLASDYEPEKEDISIIACGPMVPEAMRAAVILKEDFGIEVRIIDMHTVKPLDRDAVRRAVAETGAVLTAEEHQVGGFGNIVAGAAATGKDFPVSFVMDMVGVQDRFGESGEPWDLMVDFELVAESIAEKARSLMERKKKSFES